MKKIILSLVALSALSGVALAGHGYSHNGNATYDQNSHINDAAVKTGRIKILPTADSVDAAFEVSPATEKALDQREIRRIDEKNHGR